MKPEITQAEYNILFHSFKVFLLNNYESASISLLKKETGRSCGGIYYHFRSKKELFKQVIDNYILNVHDSKNKFSQLREMTLKEFIGYYISHIDYVMSTIPIYETENINRCYFNLLYEALRHYKGFSDQIGEVFEKDLLLWKSVVERAKQNGEIRNDLDASEVAKHFRMIYSGLSFERSLNNGLDTTELKQMFLNYYQLIKA